MRLVLLDFDFIACKRAEPELNLFGTLHGKMDIWKPSDQKKVDTHGMQNNSFQTFVAVAILAAALQIGLDTDAEALGIKQPEVGGPLAEFNAFLMGCFIFEMLIKLHCLGWAYFKDWWNSFDYVLVVASLSEVMEQFVPGLGGQTGDMRIISCFRLLRMLRLAKMLRLMRAFITLAMLMDGVFAGLPALTSVGFLLIVFSLVVGLGYKEQLLEEIPPELAAQLRDPIMSDTVWRPIWIDKHKVYFGTVLHSQITVLNLLTAEGLATLGREEKLGETYAGALQGMLVFFSYAGIFWIFNVLSSVVINRMMILYRNNEKRLAKEIEKAEEKMMAHVTRMFATIDTDSDGIFTREEFDEATSDPKFAMYLKLLSVQQDDCRKLFNTLEEASEVPGEVNQDKFVDYFLKLRGDAGSMDTYKVKCHVTFLMKRIDRLLDRFNTLNIRMDFLLEMMEWYVGNYQKDSDKKHNSVMSRIQFSRTDTNRTWLHSKIQSRHPHRKQEGLEEDEYNEPVEVPLSRAGLRQTRTPGSRGSQRRSLEGRRPSRAQTPLGNPPALVQPAQGRVPPRFPKPPGVGPL
jgi:hypothetical protein